jgi:putative NADH-flavin reductase
MADIVIFGGTGYAGSHIAREALERGHRVTSYSRNPPADAVDGVDYRTGSIADVGTVEEALHGADELVVAVHGADAGGRPLVDSLPHLAAAAHAVDARLSFVGGAGSSLVAEGGPRLVDTAEFADEWKPEALAHAEVLAALQEGIDGLRWFYVSPAALFGSWAPGETLGTYRTGGDVLVTKEDGSSEISGTDFALAYVDEIERVAHPDQRFTVGH